MRARTPIIAALAALALLGATACGGTGTDPEATSTATAPEAGATTTAAASCALEDLPLEEVGTLTVATGEPVFEPWMVDDTPSNGEGFESALVYALAEEMGFAEDDVTWVRTGFDEAVAPGDKPYDFNIQQYSITEQRDEVVDFSEGYYTVQQALVAAADSAAAEATSLADLQDSSLGAAIGSTSLDYAENVIQPDQEVAVFDENVDAKAAFDAGQVDGLVFDLPTAYFITATEIPDAEIVGVLPRVQEDPEQLGMLFEEGSELVPCVNEALRTLEDDGTLQQIEEEWLQQAGDIPTLSQ